MAEKINRLIIKMKGEEYELEGGGGGSLQPGVPIPKDTVNSNSIVDGSLMEEDLSTSVKDRMTVTYDSEAGGLRLGGYAKSGDVNNQ